MHTHFRHIALLAAVLTLAALPASAQTDTISGIINTYAKVINVECLGGAPSGIEFITSENASAFYPNDRVLLIQMKGASVSLTSDSTLGHIDSGTFVNQP